MAEEIVLERDVKAEKVFNYIFVGWCFLDILMRTSMEGKMNEALSFLVGNDNVDINRLVDVIVLVFLLVLIVFVQRYTLKEIIMISLISTPILVTAYNSGSKYLLSMFLFVIASKYAKMDNLVQSYFYVLLFMIPFILLLCYYGVLPDLTMNRNGQIRHAFGFEHPNRLGMRVFQLSACFCYITYNNGKVFLKNCLLLAAMIFVHIVPNSQTAYIGIFILVIIMFVGYIYDKYGIDKTRLMKLMLLGSVVVNVGTVILSFNNPQKNHLLNSIDRFLSRRFFYDYKMYNYYGLTWFGQKISTLVKDTKYVGVYRQWYLDNAYFSILLRFGIVVYIIFSILYIVAIYYYVKSNNFPMVAILFTYAVYGIMTTGFYMMSDNIFLLAIASPLYSKTPIEFKHGINKIRITWNGYTPKI